jgi:hypothetical protein
LPTEKKFIANKRGHPLKNLSNTVTKPTKSPFDVAGIKTKATTKDILDAIKESREGDCGQHNKPE